MRWSIASVWCLATCGHAPVTVTATDPTTGNAPSAAVAPTGFWIASTSRDWRASANIVGVASLDATHAVVLTSDRHLDVFDTRTGDVSPGLALDLPAKARPAQLLAIGGAVVLLVNYPDGTFGAWRLDASTLAPTAITLEAGAKRMTGIAVSADEQLVFGCTSKTEATLRDANLTLRKTFTVASCTWPWLRTTTEAVLESGARTTSVLDLTTGTVTAVPLPRGPKVAIDAPRGRLRSWIDATTFAWTSSSTTLGSQVIGAAQRPDVRLPATARLMARPRQGAPLVVVLGETSLAAVDLATGTVRTATDRNLEEVTRIAPLAGRVVSIAERARVWQRDGRVVDGPPDVDGMSVDDGRPDAVLLIAGDNLVAWEPGARRAAPRVLARALAARLVDGVDDNVAYENLYDVMRIGSAGTAAPWFRYVEDATLEGIDLASGRLALSLETGLAVAWPDVDKLYAFASPDCSGGNRMVLAHDAPRVAVDSADGVYVYDTTTRRSLGGVGSVEATIWDMAFASVTGDDLLLLTERTLLRWHVGAANATSWPLPYAADVDARVLGVDQAGTEVAIGFTDGTVLWAAMAEIIQDSTTIAITVLPPPPATCPSVQLPRHLDDLRGKPDEPDFVDDN